MVEYLKEAVAETDAKVAVLLAGGATIACLAAWAITHAAILVRS